MEQAQYGSDTWSGTLHLLQPFGAMQPTRTRGGAPAVSPVTLGVLEASPPHALPFCLHRTSTLCNEPSPHSLASFHAPPAHIEHLLVRTRTTCAVSRARLSEGRATHRPTLSNRPSLTHSLPPCTPLPCTHTCIHLKFRFLPHRVRPPTTIIAGAHTLT